MQIIVDKVEAAPFHALSRQDVRALLQSVPPEWLKYFSHVHLSAALEERFSRQVRLDMVKRRLIICCRHSIPERARQEILREIASHTFGLHEVSVGLTKEEWKHVDQMIAPLLGSIP